MLLPNWTEETTLIKKSLRSGWGEGIVEMAQKNPHIVVINADLPGSLKLEKFIEQYPQQYVQV